MSALDDLSEWLADGCEERGVEIDLCCTSPGYESYDAAIAETSPPEFFWEIKATDMDGYYGDESYSASVYIGNGDTFEAAAAKVMEAIRFVVLDREATRTAVTEVSR